MTLNNFYHRHAIDMNIRIIDMMLIHHNNDCYYYSLYHVYIHIYIYTYTCIYPIKYNLNIITTSITLKNRPIDISHDISIYWGYHPIFGNPHMDPSRGHRSLRHAATAATAAAHGERVSPSGAGGIGKGLGLWDFYGIFYGGFMGFF